MPVPLTPSILSPVDIDEPFNSTGVLGEAGNSNRNWQHIYGEFLRASGYARTTDTGLSMAIVDGGEANGTIWLTPSSIAGSMIVFRFRDKFNYWRLHLTKTASDVYPLSIRCVVDDNVVLGNSISLSSIPSIFTVNLQNDLIRVYSNNSPSALLSRTSSIFNTQTKHGFGFDGEDTSTLKVADWEWLPLSLD